MCSPKRYKQSRINCFFSTSDASETSPEPMETPNKKREKSNPPAHPDPLPVKEFSSGVSEHGFVRPPNCVHLHYVIFLINSLKCFPMKLSLIEKALSRPIVQRSTQSKMPSQFWNICIATTKFKGRNVEIVRLQSDAQHVGISHLRREARRVARRER